MNKELRTICFDSDLKIEAVRFEEISQSFPPHFHEHYVVGLVENGDRSLSCKNLDCLLKPGDMVLFHPGEKHACTQLAGAALNYRGLNIPEPAMREITRELTGTPFPPLFTSNLVQDEELTGRLITLHNMVMSGSGEFEKEEIFLFLLDALITRYAQPFDAPMPECMAEIGQACAFMDEHYSERITLEQLCRHCGLSKSTLLRAFTKERGITPYRYLENVRINQAKKLLEQGTSPAQAALMTGFTDQSHFTNYFSMFTGVAPGVYRKIFLEKPDHSN